jgi:hypothetical protein
MGSGEYYCEKGRMESPEEVLKETPYIALVGAGEKHCSF